MISANSGHDSPTTSLHLDLGGMLCVPQSKVELLSLGAIDRDGLAFVGKDGVMSIAHDRIGLPLKVNRTRVK